MCRVHYYSQLARSSWAHVTVELFSLNWLFTPKIWSSQGRDHASVSKVLVHNFGHTWVYQNRVDYSLSHSMSLPKMLRAHNLFRSLAENDKRWFICVIAFLVSKQWWLVISWLCWVSAASGVTVRVGGCRWSTSVVSMTAWSKTMRRWRRTCWNGFRRQSQLWMTASLPTH